MDGLPIDRYGRQSLFHHINVGYPGVELVHEDPFIFLVHDFLSTSECQQLMDLSAAATHRQPSATAPGQARLRTSSSIFPQAAEIDWLRDRIASVTNTSTSWLEPTKLTRYDKGEYFKKHTDASFLNEKMFAHSARLADVDEDGVQDPCGWPSRFCTLFIYLNDVLEGGRTRFLWLDGEDSVPGSSIFVQAMRAAGGGSGEEAAASPKTPCRDLSIAPRTGMAVIHFPSTTMETGCVPDPRTMHESETAVDRKYIVQQFIWPLPIDSGGLDASSVHTDVRSEWAAIAAAARSNHTSDGASSFSK